MSFGREHEAENKIETLTNQFKKLALHPQAMKLFKQLGDLLEQMPNDEKIKEFKLPSNISPELNELVKAIIDFKKALAYVPQNSFGAFPENIEDFNNRLIAIQHIKNSKFIELFLTREIPEWFVIQTAGEGVARLAWWDAYLSKAISEDEKFKAPEGTWHINYPSFPPSESDLKIFLENKTQSGHDLLVKFKEIFQLDHLALTESKVQSGAALNPSSSESLSKKLQHLWNKLKVKKPEGVDLPVKNSVTSTPSLDKKSESSSEKIKRKKEEEFNLEDIDIKKESSSSSIKKISKT